VKKVVTPVQQKIPADSLFGDSDANDIFSVTSATPKPKQPQTSSKVF
jgi:hypothetical protein